MFQKDPERSRMILWVLFVLTTTFAFLGSLQGLMFPLLIAAVLFKEPLRRFLSRLPLSVAFLATGLAAGLIIEIFAIIDNWDLLPAEKVLLHPNPGVDLLIALFWYGGFTLTWYLLLRKIHFSKKVVYIFSSLYGVLTEFGVLLFIISNPLLGIPLALIVTAAYGIFPLIAYMLTEERLDARTVPRVQHYIYVVLAFAIFWAIIGNFVYNPLIELFPRGF